MTQAILLDEEQSCVVSQAQEPVHVCDPAGKLLGRIVTSSAASKSFDINHWIECWTEWYFAAEEQESEDSALALRPSRQGVRAK